VNLMVMLFVMMCGALIQAVLPASPALGQAKVPALAAIVVYYALARSRRDMLWAAIVAGLVQDGLGLTPFGYSSFAFCLMAVMITRFKELVFVHEMLTHMLFGVLMAAGSTLILFVLLTSTGLIEMPVAQAFHKAFGGALLGAVATPLIFHGCAHMDRLMGLVETSDTSWQELP
jgi:rod shape-determining protein MreD